MCNDLTAILSRSSSNFPTRSLEVIGYYFISSMDFNRCIACVEIKCQLDATEVFIADLIACSTCFGHHYAHHQELKSIIQWLLRVLFCAVVFQVAALVWR